MITTWLLTIMELTSQSPWVNRILDIPWICIVDKFRFKFFWNSINGPHVVRKLISRKLWLSWIHQNQNVWNAMNDCFGTYALLKTVIHRYHNLQTLYIFLVCWALMFRYQYKIGIHWVVLKMIKRSLHCKWYNKFELTRVCLRIIQILLIHISHRRMWVFYWTKPYLGVRSVVGGQGSINVDRRRQPSINTNWWRAWYRQISCGQKSWRFFIQEKMSIMNINKIIITWYTSWIIAIASLLLPCNLIESVKTTSI